MSYNDLTRELKMFGMTAEDIKEEYIESLTGRLCGLEMVVMGILSDCQEMGVPEHVRKQLNVAKFILSEMQDRKETV
jgi:hypothetical protein